MSNDRILREQSREQPRRRGWDRRRDLGRRIVRDRRRESIPVPFERRGGAERRVTNRRNSGADRRISPPEGFRFTPEGFRPPEG